MKRDDLIGHCFGGNKEKKLEYIFPDVINKKAEVVITVGAIQSNHCRMTAIFANKFNIKTELILIRNNTMSRTGGNYLINKIANAHINIVDASEVNDKIKELVYLHKMKGNNPYFIEGGGHNELGILGYIFAVKEIKRQLDKIKITPNFIILPTGTGITQAGLIMGSKLFNYNTKIIGISVAREKERCINEILNIIMKTENFFKKNPDCEKNRGKYSIYLNDKYIGKGYGYSTNDSMMASNLLLKKEGILVDPVYNAKAFGGMIDLINKKELKGNIIYINTGGLPLAFTKEYQKNF